MTDSVNDSVSECSGISFRYEVSESSKTSGQQQFKGIPPLPMDDSLFFFIC